MEETIIVGIDIGTSKVCSIVARAEGRHRFHILGVGIEPTKGLRKGAVVDLAMATRSIRRSIEKAQRTSGMEITAAFVNLADIYAKSTNNRGVVGVAGKMIGQSDIDRALESARAVQLEHNAEVIHVIWRGFTVDGTEGIRDDDCGSSIDGEQVANASVRVITALRCRTGVPDPQRPRRPGPVGRYCDLDHSGASRDGLRRRENRHAIEAHFADEPHLPAGVLPVANDLRVVARRVERVERPRAVPGEEAGNCGVKLRKCSKHGGMHRSAAHGAAPISCKVNVTSADYR